MSCAERQLMPVPVINTALKIDPTDYDRTSAADERNCIDDSDVDLARFAENGKKDNSDEARVARGLEGAGRKGCLVLRHYYLGAARTKCLESVVMSVPVALREVGAIETRCVNLYAQWKVLLEPDARYSGTPYRPSLDMVVPPRRTPLSLEFARASQVEMVDSGLDEAAAETLLGVLLGRASTVRKLDLSRNRIGMRGANKLAHFIGEKGCPLNMA